MVKVLIFFALIVTCFSHAAFAQHFKQSLSARLRQDAGMSTNTSRYRPMFRAGDNNSTGVVKAVKHFGHLSLDPNGESKSFKYDREEMVYYILGGTGMLRYENKNVPISKNDFFYVPIGTPHGFFNPREDSLEIMVMEVEVPADTLVKPTNNLKLASADAISFQLLPQNGHGPSSRYQLLVDNVRSTRDRLAAAYLINSVYVIDFDAGCTNIPHRHKNEEEIYFMLQGNGEMVAGESPEGKEMRYPAKEDNAFSFHPIPLSVFTAIQQLEKNMQGYWRYGLNLHSRRCLV